MKMCVGSSADGEFGISESNKRRTEDNACLTTKEQHHRIAKRSRSPAGPRRLRNSDAHKRIAVPQAFCVLREHPRPRPKSGKTCRSDTRPGDVGERAERSESSDTTPIRNAPSFDVCALVCDPSPKAECVPAFARESKRGPFVPEVLKTVWTMCWKRWYDCVSCTFHGFFEDEKESRIKGWRRNRRSA